MPEDSTTASDPEEVNSPHCSEIVLFRPELSNSSSKPGTSNLNPPIILSSRFTRKRSNSEIDGWNSESKKKETPVKVKKGQNERPSKNSNNIHFRSIKETALAAQRLAAATMSQQSQQQMAGSMPQPSPSQIHQQDLPNPSYYNAPVSEHIDTNQGTCVPNPVPSTMLINSQWTANNAMPATLSSVALTPGIGIPHVVPPNGSLNEYPYVLMGNGSASLYPMPPTHLFVTPSDAAFPSVIPLFNILEPITIAGAVLTPPLPGEKRPRRERPPGCKTVFVGNLPEKITEEIVREAFQRCGQISVIRMSKKNFCHIRFVSMESVDQALLLSGFRIRIDGNEDAAFNGKLLVDYANARDDEHDWNCLQRARIREERHRQQRDNFRAPSPPPVPDFSEQEALTLDLRLRDEETYREGLQVLITWLNRGECNKRNFRTFYSLIQSSHSHVRRLRNEKSRFEEEAEKVKENLMNKNRTICLETNEIEKVFAAAKIQKVWDHFTKFQRNRIEVMKNDTIDVKQTSSSDLINNAADDRLNMSDSEDRNDAEARPSENYNDIQFRSVQKMALASQQLAAATMSQQSQQQVAVAMTQLSPLQIHQQALPDPSYYNAPVSQHIDTNQETCVPNPTQDDKPDWECLEKVRVCEERHHKQEEEDNFRAPSPPPVPDFSEQEALTLAGSF